MSSFLAAAFANFAQPTSFASRPSRKNRATAGLAKLWIAIRDIVPWRGQEVELATDARPAILPPVQDPLAVQAILTHLARSGAPAPSGPAPPAPAALP